MAHRERKAGNFSVSDLTKLDKNKLLEKLYTCRFIILDLKDDLFRICQVDKGGTYLKIVREDWLCNMIFTANLLDDEKKKFGIG